MATKTRSKINESRASDTRRVLAEYGYGTATVMDIPTKLLVIEAFQRDLSDEAVEEMAREYDRNQFQLPTVCPLPDGTYSTIDGWHRVGMARELGITTITCQIVHLPRYEDRARLFINLNRNRRWLGPAPTFKSEFEAGASWAVEVALILSDRGLEMTSKRIPNGMGCCDRIRKIYTTGGSVRLRHVLDAVLAAWPDTDPRRFSADVLGAINAFLSNNPKADLGRLTNGLQTVTGQHLLALGAQRWYGWKMIDGRGGSKIEAISEEIKKLYAKARA
ncbi:MAG: hypothetical protein NUW01_09085 [Gemmatimonadaceae bacterium]|nr:hypothetical protein [Gemmatimonadaceae bacterium]